eukprot:TRINITY_DN27699_c0_g1_i3.p1 TRINITY_DN27699_c0_g1~~TRINITY_DN27699_c0_g1_i3.p1  ORF type:complete len:164 (-),score=11.87 TRINITY_DN27699_c0_g1_i3:312-803(-)
MIEASVARSVLQLVEALSGVLVSGVSCGSGHTIALSQGQVWSWGDGSLGQLGHGTFGNRFTPAKIQYLKDREVTLVACGWWHSGAIVREACSAASRRVDKGGTLYLWGCGETGQLGNGSEDNISLPRPPKALLSKLCQAVACGKLHTLAVMLDGVRVRVRVRH